jgi:hypothetical protein
MTRFCHPRSFRLTSAPEKHNIRSRPSNHCLPFVAEAESLLFASMNRPRFRYSHDGLTMRKLKGWKNAALMFVMSAMTSIAAGAQTFTTLATFDGSNGSYPYFAPLVQGWKFLRHDNIRRVRKFRDGFQDHLRGSADDALQLLHPDRLP